MPSLRYDRRNFSLPGFSSESWMILTQVRSIVRGTVRQRTPTRHRTKRRRFLPCLTPCEGAAPFAFPFEGLISLARSSASGGTSLPSFSTAPLSKSLKPWSHPSGDGDQGTPRYPRTRLQLHFVCLTSLGLSLAVACIGFGSWSGRQLPVPLQTG